MSWYKGKQATDIVYKYNKRVSGPIVKLSMWSVNYKVVYVGIASD